MGKNKTVGGVLFKSASMRLSKDTNTYIFMDFGKIILSSRSGPYISLEVQLKTFIVIHRKPPVFKVKYFLKDYNNVQYITNLHNT